MNSNIPIERNEEMQSKIKEQLANLEEGDFLHGVAPRAIAYVIADETCMSEEEAVRSSPTAVDGEKIALLTDIPGNESQYAVVRYCRFDQPEERGTTVKMVGDTLSVDIDSGYKNRLENALRNNFDESFVRAILSEIEGEIIHWASEGLVDGSTYRDKITLSTFEYSLYDDPLFSVIDVDSHDKQLIQSALHEATRDGTFTRSCTYTLK